MPTPSLIIPSAPVYDEGNLYGLNVYGTQFAPEAIPFTRATTATRTNSAGLIELAPYNLLTYSEQFDNVAWDKINSSVSANTTTAPNGTTTADSLIDNSTNGLHVIYNSGGGLGVFTFSFYAKANTLNRVGLLTAASVNTTLASTAQVFDLSNGTVVNTISGVTATITNVGNGWYRCSTTLTALASGIYFITCIKTGTNISYIGSGESVYIWGAQLVEGTDALPYLKTETRLNRPRVDFSLGGCPNLLLEPQRTNLALQSSSFDSTPTWGYINSSVTANTTISPSGIQDADTFTANGTSNQHYTVGTASGNLTSGVAYTMSVYMKKGTNNFAQLWLTNTVGGMWANFDLNNGVVGSLGTTTGTPPTSSIQSVGNGWYRCIMTFTPTTTAAAAPIIGIIASASSVRGETNSLSTSVFVWGAQVEAGAYETSYIPTLATSVTRNADSFTESNVFSRGMITAAGGTWFVELRNNRLLAFSSEDVGAGLELGDSTGVSTNAFKFRRGGGTQRVGIWKVVGGTSTPLYSPSTDNAKIAIKWNGSTADVFVNGVKVVSATSFTTTNMEFLRYIQNQFPTYLNEMALFPTPLSDSELISLTTL